MKKRRSILPGFGLSLGYATLYLSLLVLVPLAGLFVRSASMPWKEIAGSLGDVDLQAAFRLTFGAALIAAIINAVFGFIVAWTLVRYPFPGRRLIDGLIDLPFALPTAVSGITLATLYSSEGWLGRPLESAGIHVANTQLGVLVAMIFIGVPFVVRTVQPALEDLDPEVEEAAASLGATRVQAFWRVVFPGLSTALLTGFALAFARAVGEYGSVIYISGRFPGKTQIAADFIAQKLEEGSYSGATLLGAAMLLTSFVILGLINGVQWWMGRRLKGGGAV